MASIYLKYDDIYYCDILKSDGTRGNYSTKIRVSQLGKRSAEKEAMKVAIEWEQANLAIYRNHTNLQSILGLADNLDYDAKVTLAVHLSQFLPEGYLVSSQDKVEQITYTQIRDEWLSIVGDEKSQNWLDKERQNNNIFIKFLEANNISFISDIKVSTINSFIVSKKDEGKAPNTITNYLKPVSQCLQHAVDIEYLENNPVATAHKPGTKVLKEYIHISDEILDQVIDSSDELLDRIYWTILRYTGLNPVDVSSITSKAILGDNGGKYIDGKRTKSKINVRIPVHPKVEALITEHGINCFGVYKASKKQRDNSTKRFKAAVSKASNGKIKTTLGSLRHTFITNLFNQGYSLDEIKLITGHTTTKLLTKTYVKEVDQVRAHEAIDKLK